MNPICICKTTFVRGRTRCANAGSGDLLTPPICSNPLAQSASLLPCCDGGGVSQEAEDETSHDSFSAAAPSGATRWKSMFRTGLVVGETTSGSGEQSGSGVGLAGALG